jgi:hypothetical protein
MRSVTSALQWILPRLVSMVTQSVLFHALLLGKLRG